MTRIGLHMKSSKIWCNCWARDEELCSLGQSNSSDFFSVSFIFTIFFPRTFLKPLWSFKDTWSVQFFFLLLCPYWNELQWWRKPWVSIPSADLGVLYMEINRYFEKLLGTLLQISSDLYNSPGSITHGLQGKWKSTIVSLTAVNGCS